MYSVSVYCFAKMILKKKEIVIKKLIASSSRESYTF